MFNIKIFLTLIAIVAIATTVIISQEMSMVTLHEQDAHALKGGCWDCWALANCRTCGWEPYYNRYIKCERSYPYLECYYGKGTYGQTCGDCTSHDIDCGGNLWICVDSECEACTSTESCSGCDDWSGHPCEDPPE
jgi:hypothetical protein